MHPSALLMTRYDYLRVLSSLAVNSVILKISLAVVPFLSLFYLLLFSGFFPFLSEFCGVYFDF
jgi:hypothetical protein